MDEMGYDTVNLEPYFTPDKASILNITLDRLERFASKGQWEDVNLQSMLTLEREDSGDAITLEVYSVPDLKRIAFSEAIKNKFKKTHKGESFGPSWSTHWFRVTLQVPKRFQKYERVEFQFNAGNEGAIWTKDGKMLQGLSGGYGFVSYILPQSVIDSGQAYIFYVEMACNDMFGNAPSGKDSIQPPDPNKYFTLSTADVVAPDLNAWGLYYDFYVLREMARELPGNSSARHRAVLAANEIMNVFDHTDRTSIKRCREIAKTLFGDVDGPEMYDEKVTHNDTRIAATGHCHIDSAWLWSFAETKRKVARSWTTQMHLMDQYPEHRFSCSQAQQFKWLETLYPEAFERLKKKVKTGQFEPLGGAWVEFDTNLPSGESICRQFLYGQRYFESRFGKRSNVFWLPDTFGYSAQLPQLARLGGMEYFFTQKLSWNNINDFPHTTFNWVGLDGSQVLAHLSPANTYTAPAVTGDVLRSVSQNKDIGSANGSGLLVFGNGDGGGGPIPEMFERLRRIRAAANGFAKGHLGKVVPSSVTDFYDNLRKESNNGKDLNTWYGELYFELHRGTYTSHGWTKRGNRMSEILLREVEYFSTLASLIDESFEYPKPKLDPLWEMVLLCQFHDVLPGSAIEEANIDAREMYAKVAVEGAELLDRALRVVFPKSIDTKTDLDEHYGIIAANSTDWVRHEVIKVPLVKRISDMVSSGHAQVCADGKSAFTLINIDGNSNSLVGMSFASVIAPETNVSLTKKGKNSVSMRNSRYVLDIDGGLITSFYDLEARRELIPSGSMANQFIIYEDQPLFWDAWDVEVYHLQKGKEVGPGRLSILESGPLRASVQIRYQLSEKSWLKSTISLDAIPNNISNESTDFSVVRFETEVEWHESHKFLKVEFPLTIQSDTARYEVQYGIAKRPTFFNTSWDIARFEVCGHRFADLSEFGYGVALLSDCKYGYATHGNTIRLSLLRSPKSPDAHTDMGHHTFNYGLFPHRGSFDEADVVKVAHQFNFPIHVRGIESVSPTVSRKIPRISIHGARNVVLDTIKRGEDDSNEKKTVIVRLYEAYGGHAEVKLRTSLPLASAYITNILEDSKDQSPEACQDLDVVHEHEAKETTVLPIQFRPFQVVTVKLIVESLFSDATDDGWVKIKRL